MTIVWSLDPKWDCSYFIDQGVTAKYTSQDLVSVNSQSKQIFVPLNQILHFCPKFSFGSYQLLLELDINQVQVPCPSVRGRCLSMSLIFAICSHLNWNQQFFARGVAEVWLFPTWSPCPNRGMSQVQGFHFLSLLDFITTLRIYLLLSRRTEVFQVYWQPKMCFI